MFSFIDNRQPNGLRPTLHPKLKYYVTEKYYMVSYRYLQDNILLNVYLRPYKGDKTIVTAYIDDFNYIESITKTDKSILLRFISHSKIMADLLGTKQGTPNKIFLSKIQDLEEEGKKSLCIQKVIDYKLTAQHIITGQTANENITFRGRIKKGFSYLKDKVKRIRTYMDKVLLRFKYTIHLKQPASPSMEVQEGRADTVQEGNQLINTILEFYNLYNEFIETRKKHLRDLNNAYWKRKLKVKLAKNVIDRSEGSYFGGDLILKTDKMEDVGLRNVILKYKVIINVGNFYYTIGSNIRDKDINKDIDIYLLAEIFDKCFKDTGYIFHIGVKENKMRINLGRMADRISKMTNHVNTKAWEKIPLKIYKSMPITSDLWWHSNEKHDGARLSAFTRNDDREIYDIWDPLFRVRDSYLIFDEYTFNYKDPWNDICSMIAMMDIINESITIIHEFQQNAPKWYILKKIETSVNILRPFINPYQFFIRKMIKLISNLRP